jgi:protein phosphatase
MVDDERVQEIVTGAGRDLERAARELIAAANRGGGEDNITVVLFEIGDVAAAAATDETRAIPVVDDAEVEEDTLDETDRVPAIDTMVVPAAEIEHHLEEAEGSGRSYARRFLYSFLVLALVVLIILALLWGFSRAHFVGARSDGRVAVYRGVPWDIVGGVRLYHPVYVSRLRAAELTPDERRALFDHSLHSEDTARAELLRYARKVRPA